MYNHISSVELPDLISLTNADLETTINAAKHAVSLLYDPKGKLKSCHHDRSMRVKLATSKRRFHPARQHWLSVGGSNYSDKDHFPDMGTTQCSLSFSHSKYSHGTFKSCHHDLNMLRVKLATNKDSPLSRIPPSEPSFKQHVQKGNKCLEPRVKSDM
jgi:hypothetical protein